MHVLLVLLPPGDAGNIVITGDDDSADAVDGRTKLPSMPIILPSSTSPAVLIENILKHLPNLRIDPVGKSEVIIEPFPSLVVCNNSHAGSACTAHTSNSQITHP